MQALMLAAGMGKRLGKYTQDNTKCMVEIAGEKLLDRAIEAVQYAGIKKFILVVGYKAQNVINYVQEKYSDSDIEFVFIDNKDYANSNNIYSFYMAKEYLEKDDTILLESDLIYDKSLIKQMVNNENKNLVAVASYKSWMDGTVVTCDENDNICQFIEKIDMDLNTPELYFKTVNVYKFSVDFLKNVYLPFLEAYMKAYGLNSYYETVLKVISHSTKSGLKAFYMNDLPWYEIDDAQDLDIATVMFSKGKAKYDAVISKFGGYWRYERMLDYCYLVNPYFPPKRMFEKLNKEYSTLLTEYPSGLSIQNLNAERMFGVDQDKLIVGNGAAELINVFGRQCEGDVAVALPTFNEYVRCFDKANLIKIDNSQNEYKHDLAQLKEMATKVNYLCLVNPDNPSGFMLSKAEMLELLDVAKTHKTIVLFDESFIDFAIKEKRYSLLDDEILNTYDNLVVIKSISKSYGVPALRLGIMATANVELRKKIISLMPVWNINSFAEYFLQIFNLFEKDYFTACDKIAQERTRMTSEINKIVGVHAFDSAANFIMIDLGKVNSYEFCVDILDKYNILIKDLSTKNYFNGKNYIRIAVRNKEQNSILINAIKEIYKIHNR